MSRSAVLDNLKLLLMQPKLWKDLLCKCLHARYLIAKTSLSLISPSSEVSCSYEFNMLQVRLCKASQLARN